jgi:hypothetical protein
MHMSGVTVVRLKLGQQHMLLGFLPLAVGEVEDVAKFFWADVLAQHAECHSGPWLSHFQALCADVGDEQTVMLCGPPPAA